MKMYKKFFVHKRSATYSEILESFGLASLVDEILARSEIEEKQIIIEDEGPYYSVTSSEEITEAMITNLDYFQVINFIKKDVKTTIPAGIARSSCFDYPSEKAVQDKYKSRYDEIEKNKSLSAQQRKAVQKKLNEDKLSEVDIKFDVYRELTKNPYTSFTKLHENFHRNQKYFPELITEILDYYSSQPVKKRHFKLSDDQPTAQQLFNPNQGKGLNKSKANNLSMGNLKAYWVTETMKISGALEIMSVQYVKVGSSYDLKIYVPDFKNIQLRKAIDFFTKFKRPLKSTSPIKLDILNMLDLITQFILSTPEYNGKPKNTVKGFHTVYQKDLGQNKAVANIAFTNTPDFIEYSSKQEGKAWIDVLKEQRNIISNIEELGASVEALKNYRNFLGSTKNNAFEYFANFSYWYCAYLMQSLDKEKYYVKPFKVEILTKFYIYMDIKLSEILNNEGFKAVAQAIRKSTVLSQYTKKEHRKFEVRYGLAQQLQNKARSKEDLITFIGGFITNYNSEIALKVDSLVKSGIEPQEAAKSLGRRNIKDSELVEFYELLDKSPSNVIGALLASYGFALNKKDKSIEETPLEDQL